MLYFRSYSSGPLAEWLGSALQKLLQRFESARDLRKKSKAGQNMTGFLFVSDLLQKYVE